MVQSGLQTYYLQKDSFGLFLFLLCFLDVLYFQSFLSKIFIDFYFEIFNTITFSLSFIFWRNNSFFFQITYFTTLIVWLFSIEGWLFIEFFYLLYLFVGTIYFFIIFFLFKYNEVYFKNYQKQICLSFLIVLFLVFVFFEIEFENESPLNLLFCFITIFFHYYINKNNIKKLASTKCPQERKQCLEKSVNTTKLEIEKLRVYYKLNPHILNLKFGDRTKEKLIFSIFLFVKCKIFI
jgi:hypothetical protein